MKADDLDTELIPPAKPPLVDRVQFYFTTWLFVYMALFGFGVHITFVILGIIRATVQSHLTP